MAYQARLESACSRKATVGSNPTLSATLFLMKPRPLYPPPLLREGEFIIKRG